MAKIDTILFDWDGTLAQTLEIWLKTFKEAYAAVNVYPSDTDISSGFGNWQAHIELGVRPEDEKVYQKHLEVVYDRLNNVPLYEGVPQVLERLQSSGYKLGLVSTSNRRMIDTALAVNQLGDLFNATVAAEDTVKHKPDPEPLFVAIEQLETLPENTIFVGDSDKDTGAAMNAGIDLLLFTPENHRIYYDLEKLRAEPSVVASFNHWNNFPFGRLD